MIEKRIKTDRAGEELVTEGNKTYLYTDLKLAIEDRKAAQKKPLPYKVIKVIKPFETL